jgi:hypothetical protein
MGGGVRGRAARVMGLVGRNKICGLTRPRDGS